MVISGKPGQRATLLIATMESNPEPTWKFKAWGMRKKTEAWNQHWPLVRLYVCSQITLPSYMPAGFSVSLFMQSRTSGSHERVLKLFFHFPMVTSHFSPCWFHERIRGAPCLFQFCDSFIVLEPFCFNFNISKYSHAGYMGKFAHYWCLNNGVIFWYNIGTMFPMENITPGFQMLIYQWKPEIPRSISCAFLFLF